MKQFILAIDSGTSSSRSVLFDKKGTIVSIAQLEFTQYFPKPSWVEHDADEIWKTQLNTIQTCIKQSSILPSQIAGIGITNQRETVVVWDKATGKPISRAIVWQDRRTSSFCDTLKSNGHTNIFAHKTGLIIDAYFSATKVKWILDQEKNFRIKAKEGKLLFGTIDSWLIWKLTEGKSHVTDVSNASRTMLYNIRDLRWDPELLEIMNIPVQILPKVCASSEVVGKTAKSILGAEIPIAGIAGDQQASLFGHTCFTPGMVKNTYGTGCFCIMNTGNKIVVSRKKLLSTIAWKINDEITYGLEGSVFVAGSLVQWLRDQLKLFSRSSDVESLAKTVNDNGGITVIPSLAGLAAPYWQPKATGAIFGITRGTEAGHLARASLEAIAMRVYEVVQSMKEDVKKPVIALKVDGGASANDLLMQYQANFLKAKIVRPKITEITALGAAYLAGLAVGIWENLSEIKSLEKTDATFSPVESEATQTIKANWQKRIQKILSE